MAINLILLAQASKWIHPDILTRYVISICTVQFLLRSCLQIAYRRPNLRGPVYNPNKADRLAIIDPNKPDNDISGGSKNVMQIFHRFARARHEILKAMKSPHRASLLDWSLGGNYESFVWQRDHLRSLYRQRWGTPEQDVV